MRAFRHISAGFSVVEGISRGFWQFFSLLGSTACASLSIPVLLTGFAGAQVNVLTAHNDIGRTGQNTHETVLTPTNVNPQKFGKLFSQPVHGGTYGQPLYVFQVPIPTKGTHNVVYVGTTGDIVYAFDADTNGGVSASPLWSVSLLTNTAPAGTYTSQFGVYGTPVIDLPSQTLYLVSSETTGSASVFRLHGLDITTGAEKFGGPVLLQASIPGTGTGSSGGVLKFDPTYVRQRPGLLLLNGVVYIAFGSSNDVGPWHGWIFSYNATNLQQINVYCPSVNGTGAGFWMSGAGLAAEVSDPKKPYGRMFVVTGNGSYTAAPPYSSTASYSMSVLDLDLTGGVMTVQDEFTPFNWKTLNSQDGDLGSGGLALLPQQTLASGKTLNPLVQMGKSGTMYILDRNNLGGFNASGDQIASKVQTPESGANNWGAGIWGSVSYWNNNLYFGGVSQGTSNSVTAYSFLKGVPSAAPTSQTAEQYPYPGPTPSISSNGATNGIVWVLNTSAYQGLGPDVLLAYDATNLGNLLYSSNANLSRDNPGGAVKFTVPTVANGKVYVGASYQMSVYGLLGVTPTVAAPVFSPPSGSFTGSQTVTLTDATSGARIYYTTDGSTPTINSKQYTKPLAVTSSQTIMAIASASGYLQGSPSSATYSSTANAANPVFSLASGSYSGPQSVSIADSSSGSAIYYTVDGSTPTTASILYTGPVSVSVSETVRAIATAPGLLASSVVSATYDLDPVYTFNFSQGFAQAQGPIQFNGSTDLDDFRLQLTNGGQNEKASAFYATPVNIQSFTTDFTFQISNPGADGFTFTIQNVAPTAIGGYGGSLGYKGINKSVAIKFDIFNNGGEGPNSTGMYLNGAQPGLPAIDLTGTGIDLHNGNYTNAHITYDGTNLTMTLTNPISLASWSHSFAVDIPSVVGGATAYVGFTAGTGGASASQKLTSWIYLAGPPPLPSYPAGFDAAGMTLNGAVLAGTALQLTSDTGQHTSAYYSTPIDVQSFTTDFDFQLNQGATADGLTMVIQNAGLAALGSGSGGLGYAGMPNSVAIKMDIFNNSGEGTDSTGLYVNGAMPTVPATNITSGLQLNSGDVIHAHVTYDGTTLTWKLTDLTYYLHFSGTYSAKVNIPQTLGSNTGYFGFTAASGDGSAVQQILDWTLTNP